MFTTNTFDPVNAADGFSNVAALLSGFALTGFFLLIERLETDEPEVRRAYLRALLLLFVSFLVGTVTSFLYASVMGDNGFYDRAMYAFMFPNSTFAITTFTLLAGLNIIISAFRIEQALKLSRFIFGFIILFGIARLLVNSYLALDYFGVTVREKIIVGTWGFLPSIISLIIVLGSKNLRRKIEDNTILAFAFFSIVLAFILAAFQAPYPIAYTERATYSFHLALAVIILVSLVGSWSLLIVPERPVKLKEPPSPIRVIENQSVEHRETDLLSLEAMKNESGFITHYSNALLMFLTTLSGILACLLIQSRRKR